ncbi:hypothetical protein A4G19_03695 [Pasteurellaceae bacterium Macca]|nr:hypothetical protein [Pasteurellaceae bacterium Macca]
MSKKNNKQNAMLSEILDLTRNINDKVEQQNAEILSLKKEVKALEQLVNTMNRKNRNTALIAGALGGGVASVGFELLRLKFGG